MNTGRFVGLKHRDAWVSENRHSCTNTIFSDPWSRMLSAFPQPLLRPARRAAQRPACGARSPGRDCRAATGNVYGAVFDQLSFKDTVRLKTGAPDCESGSAAK